MPGIERLRRGENVSGSLPAIATTIDEKSRWFLNQLDIAITTSFNNTHPQSKYVFHSSVVGTPCNRFLYFHYNGLLPFIVSDAKSRRRLDVGHSAETRYEAYFRKMRAYVQKEVSARLERPPIHGRADFILTFPQIGLRRVVVELKTINNADFQSLVTPVNLHVVQLQSYLNILAIDNGIILYEDKNNQSLKSFFIERNNTLWQQVVERCEWIQTLAIPPEVDKTVVHDRYCKCLGYRKSEH